MIGKPVSLIGTGFSDAKNFISKMSTSQSTEKQQSTALSIPPQQIVVAQQIDGIIKYVISKRSINGFEKALVQSTAISQINTLLTKEYMKPICDNLAGKKIGFLTDLDTKGGYTEEKIKSCVIDAILSGLEVVGNHFNIIQGKMYITKEGASHLLRTVDGLWYEIIPDIPKVDNETQKTYVICKIHWKYSDVETVKDIKFPIIVNNGSSTDAVIGKAKRKAMIWLYNELFKCEYSDGEVQDVDAVVVETTLKNEQPNQEQHHQEAEIIDERTEKEKEDQKRSDTYLDRAKDVEDLDKRLAFIESNMKGFNRTFYNQKLKQLQGVQ